MIGIASIDPISGPSASVRPVAAYDPPQIGAAIGPLSEVILRGPGPSGLGRLGAFAIRRGARDVSEVLALTCHHVVGTDNGALVYQPHPLSDGGHRVLTEAALNPIGCVADPGMAGAHAYAFPGDAEARYFVDCAAVRLHTTPDRTVTLGAARLHPLDIAPPRSRRVRLLGLHDTARGEVAQVAATVSQDDGPPAQNTIVIETIAGQPPFAGPGESGALVVDDLDRAIGLLWGTDLQKPTRAFACHLLPALDRLGLVLLRAAGGMPGRIGMRHGPA